MQNKEAYFTLIHVMILFLLFGIGSFFTGLAFAPNMRFHIAKVILYEEKSILLFGSGLLLLSFLLLLLFYGLHKKRSFQLKMDPYPAEVDSNIVKGYLENFLQKEYPEKVKNLDVVILSDQKMEIILKLSPMDVEEKEMFLKHSEEEMGKILSKILDYNREFFLTVNL